MKIRTISGACYIAILVAFYALKVCIPTYGDFCFDALIYAFALLGSFEMLRATKASTTKAERILVYVFTAVCIPATALCEYFFHAGFTAIGVSILALGILLLSLLVSRHEETSLESLGASLLSAIYPTLFLALLSIVNHASSPTGYEQFAFDSRVLLLFVFVITPCADSIAYVAGRFLRKYFPKKMAPVISPNKTVVGGIGGLVGGMLGATAVYFIYNAVAGSFEQMYIWLPVYLGIGLVASLATMFGDLVESCIKRKLGLKDMGNIMPGHGGALDRLDSSLFSTIVAYIAYILVTFIV